jgi:hypothetical protein
MERSELTGEQESKICEAVWDRFVPPLGMSKPEEVYDRLYPNGEHYGGEF